MLAVTPEAARLAAIDGARLQAEGQRLDVPDLLIIGAAKEAGLGLVTRNVRHFGRIEGLTLLDPA
jgi:tRNA(fMet)-specific endonuclease VapC